MAGADTFRHVIWFHFSQNRRVYISLDDMASNICQALQTGDTAVTVHLSGYTPRQHKLFYCRFGDKTVPAELLGYFSERKTLALVCNAPPRAGDYDTEMRLSLDGDVWTAGAFNRPLLS